MKKTRSAASWGWALRLCDASADLPRPRPLRNGVDLTVKCASIDYDPKRPGLNSGVSGHDGTTPGSGALNEVSYVYDVLGMETQNRQLL